jgi:hypothetical protein
LKQPLTEITPARQQQSSFDPSKFMVKTEIFSEEVIMVSDDVIFIDL